MLRTDARVLVLGSASPAMFCSGADLAIDSEERALVSRELYSLYEAMIGATIPIIAALDGPAVGGGAQLALAADLRIASPQAWIRFVGPGHGLAVGAWGLPSLVGRGRALDLCLSGERVAAEQAYDLGLLERLAEDPIAAAQTLAAHWAELDSDAVARVKAITGAGLPRAGALAAEARGNAAWQGVTK